MKAFLLTVLIAGCLGGYAVAGVGSWSDQLAGTAAIADGALEICFDGYGSPGDPEDLVIQSRDQVADASVFTACSRAPGRAVPCRRQRAPRVRSPPLSFSS